MDVGGAVGNISLGIAQGFESLQFIVQDQAPLEQQVKQIISSYPEEISKRVTFVAHDFF